MSTSPKRYGLDVKDDLELELRLRRIEAALEGKLNTNSDSEDQSGSRSAVPQVTGLRVTGQTPGSVSISWNSVAIPNLRRYDVEFSQSIGFTDKQTFSENTTSYTFITASETGGGGGATWFARVRAVNVFKQTGQYSATLNLATGQAQTEDLANDAVTDVKVAPETTIEIITTGLRGIIDGFTLSRTSTTVLTVSAGFATTSVEGSYARLTTADTVNLTISGVGGLGVARAVSTWYHVFVIVNSSGSARVYADTSVTAANIPSGYSAYRRIGSFRTDSTGSGELTAFTQYGDEFLWAAPVLDVDTASPGTSAVTVTLSVPTGVVVKASFNSYIEEASETNAVYFSALTLTDSAPSASAAPLAQSGMANFTDGTTGQDFSEHAIWTNVSAQIRYRMLVDRQIRLATSGWVDQRGRNA